MCYLKKVPSYVKMIQNIITIITVLCRWAYVRKYGQLTDITGRPISRASSASSAQPFQQRPRAVDRSLTCDSDLSGSSSGSDGEGEGEDIIPAGQLQDGLPSRKKTGVTAVSQHSAKSQGACKRCHSQQCCTVVSVLSCSYALAHVVTCECFSNSIVLLAMYSVFAHICNAVFSPCCDLRVCPKCHRFVG